jgi:hypothetical protein
MHTKIVRLHSVRRNPAHSAITSAEIRELRRLVAEQDRVIADLIMDMRALKAAQPPAPFGLDGRGPY